MNLLTNLSLFRPARQQFLMTGLLVLLFLLTSAGAQAQGVAQVNLSGVPPVLQNPSVSAQVERYEQRQMNMEFIYTSPGIAETEFRFRFLVEHEGMPVIDVTSQPVAYRPGVYRYESFDDFPEIEFNATLADVISQLNSAQGGLINQTGNLAEGAYTISVEPEAANDELFITEIPAFATFTVRYVEPPVLTSPADGSVVSGNFPLFSWTEAGGLPPGSMTEYELTIVELFDGQSPGVAIRSNRPVYNDILTSPVFVYGSEQLPLEPGNIYAWQVRARETTFGIPFTQQGLTEIYTFRVMDDDGYITDRFDWSYPAGDPFAEVRVEDARIGSNNVILDGAYSGTIGGTSGGFTFEEFILSPDGNSIDGGRVILDRTVGFEAAIYENNSLAAFMADTDSPPEAERAVWFTPGFLQVGPAGITPAGMGVAVLRYDGQTFDNLDIRFSQDFLIGHGMQIIRGQATFMDNGMDIAEMVESGFRFIAGEEDLIALLPERLPLPDERVAWLRLRDGEGNPLVQAIRTSDGSGVAISPLDGEPPVIGLEFMDGSPELQADIQGLVLDPTLQRMISGQVVSQGANEHLLEEFGLPVVLEQITYSPEQSLEFHGMFNLFGHRFENGGDITLRLGDNGRLYGLVNVQQAGLTLPLAGREDQVALELSTIVGSIDIHPLSPYRPRYSLDIGADFVITGSGGSAARAVLAGNYHSDGEFSFGSLQQPAQQPNPALLELDRVHLSIDQITSLELTHREAAAFDFNAALDVSVLLAAGNSDFNIPLQNVELRNSGFLIPAQNLHEDLSGFDNSPFEVEPVELRLLAMRMEGVLFNWFEWEEGTPSGLHPFFDFEVRFPGFSGRSEALASATATLQEAELDEGVISGSLLPYSFIDGARVPIEGTSGIRVQEINGRFYRDGSQQAVDIDMDAVLHAPDLFAGEAESCSPSVFTLGLTFNSLFEGRADGISLCQTIGWNAVELHLDEGYVDFSVVGGSQSVTAGGDVTAALTRSWLEGPDAAGTIELNVLTGEVTDLDAAFTDITWQYPAGTPVLTFGVNSANLTPDGILMDSDGHLALENQQIGSRLEELLMDVETGEIREGGIEILESFGIKADVSPYRWAVTAQDGLSSDDQNTALLVLPPGQRIDRDGMDIAETTAAYAQINGVVDGEIDTEFNNFILCFSPLNVCSGQVDLNTGSRRLGYIDRSGFTFEDPVVETDLPERLGLPTEEVAYLVLREGDLEMVELTEPGTGGTLRMSTPEGETVRLVLAGFGDEGNHPEVNVSIDVTVNSTSFEIVNGQIELDLANDPVLLNEYGMPLAITRLLYSEADGSRGYTLRASAGLTLPGSISDEPLEISSMITFSTNGFETAEITLGNYSATRLSNTDEMTPLIRVNDEPIPAGLDLYGAKIKTGGQQQFRFSGDLRSRFIRDSGDQPAAIHYYASFHEVKSSWEFTADLSHLPGETIPFDQAGFQQSDGVPIVITAGENEFGADLTGTMSFPGLGNQFAFSIEQLYLGSSSVELKAVDGSQQLSLFGEFLTLTVDNPGMNYDSDSGQISLTLNGDLLTNIQKARAQEGNTPEPLEFDNLFVSTDGSFVQQTGDGNLLGGEPMSILGDFFWIDGLRIGFKEFEGTEQFLLTAEGGLNIPTPGKTSPAPGSSNENRFEFIIDANGDVVQEPQLEFIFDSNELPELKEQNQPGVEYQYTIPDFATVQTTGVKIDYDVFQPVNTALKGAFAVHVNRDNTNNDTGTGTGTNNTNNTSTSSTNKQNTTTSDATDTVDPEGNTRIIHFGKAAKLDDRYGISYTFGDNLAFHVDVSGTKEDPLFSFVAGYFNIDLVSVQIDDPTVFEVEIGGYAGLTLPQVSGSMGYAGFRFGAGGITDFGRPTGAFSLSVEGIVSLSVGGFVFEEQEANGQPVEMPFYIPGKTDDGVPITRTTYKDVKRYLKLTDVGITLGGGSFDGGVEQVLYYENMDDQIFFSIQDARITLNETASIWANFKLAVGTGGDFALDVAGVADLQNVGVGVYGTVRKWEEELSFGIFVAAADLHLDLFAPFGAPNAVYLTGMGAGFFYRPKLADLLQVQTLLEELTGEFSYNNPNGFPETDNLLFSIMLFGQVGIAGNPTAGFAATGDALLLLTDAFANIDINVYLLEQVGQPEAPGTLKAGAYFTAGWKNNFLLQGGMKTEVEYPVVNGNSKIDFFLQGQPDSDELLWGATGNVRLTLINFVDIAGNFTVNKSGMLVNLGGRIGFDVFIVSVNSEIGLSFWYYTQTENLGLYASFGVNASVAGGAASIGVLVEGALISENNELFIFAQGTGYAEIAGVFEGDVSVWVSMQNDGSGTKFDAGLGRKAEYEKLVRSAQNRAEAMNNEARELNSQIAKAKIAEVSLSQAELRAAGINLRSLSASERSEVADEMIQLESRSYEAVGRPAMSWNNSEDLFRNLAENIVRSSDQPERPAALPGDEQLNESLEEMNQVFDNVAGQMETMEQEYEYLLPDLPEPFEIVNPMQSSDLFGFEIDVQAEEQRIGNLESSFAGLGRLGEDYREQLEENRRILEAYIDALHDINELLPEILAPYEMISEYYARQISYHRSSYDYAYDMYYLLREQETRQSSMHLNNATTELFPDGEKLSEGYVPTQARRNVLIEQAAGRYELMKELALANDSLAQAGELQQSVDEFKSAMEAISDLVDDANTEYNEQLEPVLDLTNTADDQGVNLWRHVLRYSIVPYRDWNLEQFNSLIAERNEVIQELSESYKTVISRMSRMYGLLSRMIEDQIAMYDEYIEWAGNSISQDEKNVLLNNRKYWAQMLQPPAIESISASPQPFERTNRLTVEWEASHPSGQLGQSVIRFVESGTDPVLLSGGTQTSATKYLIPAILTDDNASLRNEIGVRGPGGTLVLFGTELKSYELGSGEPFDETTPAPSVNVGPSVQDPPPPSVHVRTFESPQGEHVMFADRIPFSLAPGRSAVPLRLEYALARLNENDEEETMVVDWAEGNLSTTPPSNPGIVYFNYEFKEMFDIETTENGEGTQFGVIESSLLEHNRRYRLLARSLNPFGTYSTHSGAIFHYDATPPEFSESPIIIEYDTPSVDEPGYSHVTGFQAERPEQAQSYSDDETGGRVNPDPVELQLTWPEAGDPESAVSLYQVIASAESDSEQAFEMAYDRERALDPDAYYSLNGTQDGLFWDWPKIEYDASSYGDGQIPTDGELNASFYKSPWYIHVRALNVAQNRVYIRSDAQPLMTDFTRPFVITRPGQFEGEPVLWVNHPPVDRESGIAGIQFAIGKSEDFYPDLEDIEIVKPFPEGTDVDFGNEPYHIPASGNLAPGYYLRDLDLETWQNLFILVRAVNNAGYYSDISIMDITDMPRGEDTTPPLPGDISHEYVTNFVDYEANNGEWLSVEVDGLHDPGSDIVHARFRLLDAETGEVAAESEYETNGHRHPGSAFTAELRHPGAGIQLGGGIYQLEVTATNGAGLETTQTEEVDLTVPPIPEFGLTAKVEYRRQGDHSLTVYIKGIQLNKTGLSRVDIQVEDGDTGEEILPWTLYGDDYLEEFNFRESVDLIAEVFNNNFWARRLRISVRVYDGAGQPTTVSIYYGKSTAN